MHEMAITVDIVDAAIKYAEQNNATAVTDVHLRIGEIHDVVADLMQGAFRFLARDTIAKDAVLHITKVELRARCSECNLVFPANLWDKSTLKCPDCGQERLTVYSGKEFMIERIEII